MTLRAFAGGLLVAAATGLCLCLCAAQAADLPPAPKLAPVAPVAYAPEVYDWTGFYFGGHLGGGFSNSSWSDAFTGANDKFHSAGFLGGGQVGVNAQFNSLVLGLEGDFSWTGLGLKGSGTDSLGSSINTTVDWTSTITGRIGVAFNRVLLYGKGGLALAQDDSTLTDLAGNSASTTLMRTGWTAGAGIEYAIDKNWSARLEYDYVGFGSQTLNFSTPLQPAYTSSANLNVQEIKAGLNFRFGQ